VSITLFLLATFNCFSLSFPLFVFLSPVALLHSGSEMDNTVIMLTSMESLKVRATKDIYLPRYMVSTTPFTVDGLSIYSKASNRWTSSAIVLKSTEVSILFVCFLDALIPASAVLSDAPTVSYESRDQ